MRNFNRIYPVKRKNTPPLSPEAREWLRTILIIAILPGTLLFIGLFLWLSRSF